MSKRHDHNHGHNHGQPAQGMTVAFLLNLTFSIFELVGGLFTGSVAILSDALHDLGDAAGIGLSCLLEKKSRRCPDATHTYGYLRYSVLGSFIITGILLVGSCGVIIGAIHRVIVPVPIHYDGMILFAVIGVTVNTAAALLTRHGDSINRRAVSLHLLEDVLGWIVVLIGALVMRFTDLALLDPLMSAGVAIFILIHALKNMKVVLDLFLEKTPAGVDITELIRSLSRLDGVVAVHHLHLRSLDGFRHEATLHAVIDGDTEVIKPSIRGVLARFGVVHATIETEAEGATCEEVQCPLAGSIHGSGQHHPHGHHHGHG